MRQPQENKNNNSYEHIREPAVAGQFYPGGERDLAEKINSYLGQAQTKNKTLAVGAILVPHAGYDFSAPVAAYAYQTLQGRKINTAVLISNSHTSYFAGAAIDNSSAWRTPLGIAEVDWVLAKKLTAYDASIMENSQVHEFDHTLEVQIPFLQTVLSGNFKIVPILFGNTKDKTYLKLAAALVKNLGKDDIIIISTDLSHYPNYDEANKIDAQTLELIQGLDIANLEQYIEKTKNKNILHEETLCCGIDAVKTIMAIAGDHKWQAEVLKYANSGDVLLGNQKKVVGYGAMIFGSNNSAANQKTAAANTANDLSAVQRQALLNIARQSVEKYIKDGKLPEFNIKDPRLEQKEGAFVTLHKNGQLRGCIGQIIPSNEPLWRVVRDMAIAAAVEDGRFSPVSAAELKDLEYEISILSVPREIKSWQDIELGVHGVIIKKGRQSGVFLPQVAVETGWSKEEFLRQLCTQKAGLTPDCYKNGSGVEIFVFAAQVFSEPIEGKK